MKRLLFLFFFLLIKTTLAQELLFNSPPAFQNLPSIETYDILQDRKGFIWVTTDAGICRYDGTELKVFTTRDGISENVVFKVYEDDKGRIWFTTISGYFFYYENKIFHSIEANTTLKKLCASFPITSFFIGEHDTLYCATNLTRGLMKIPSQDNYKNILIDSTRSSSCTRFVVTNKLHPEECVMGNGYRRAHSTYHSFILNEKRLEIITRGEDEYVGNYWKGASDVHGTIYIPYGKQLTIISKEGTFKGSYYFSGIVTASYLDADNDLWVCTSKGGYLFKNADLSKAPVHFLNTLSISHVRMDREGCIWATTLEKGVFRSINKHLLFFNTEKDKAVYLQTDSNQLHISFLAKRVISLYKNDSIYVNDLKINSPYNLFSCYMDHQMSCFGFSNEFYYWDKKKSALPIKISIKVSAKEILKVGTDSIVVLTPYALVTVYKDKTEVIRSPFPMQSILQLKNKKILISSRNNSGIFEFKDKKFIPYLDQLAKVRVNCMTEDLFGNLWIATNEQGLYCYDYKKKLHHLKTTNNLISDKINALTTDKKNNLWIGSSNGLSKLTYTKELQKIEVSNFNKSHGIPSLQIEKICSFNNKIACISNGTFFYFESDEMKKNSTPPLNYIESVWINDNPYNVKNSPVLSHDQNNFHVFSSLLTYKNTELRKFLYMLVGYDQNWHYSTSGDVLYTNLPSGKYEFMIYGLNNDDLKSNTPATFSFEIKKPFWFTWWFILLEAASLLTAIYFYFRFWKSKIEKREHEKMVVNQKIAEFKMTALRAQMNPHFIFNAIGSIQHYILKNEIKQSYNYLSKFSMLIRNILNNSRQEYISLQQEINTLQLYIELEQIRFTEPFKFIIEIDEQLDMDMEIPTMLIQPYVENSIWHGLMPKTTTGTLHLLFKKVSDTLLVITRDDGVGRTPIDPTKKTHVSKGMSLTEQRIEALETTNKQKFSTTIIDLKDKKDSSIGTEINLIIPFDLN